MVTGAGGSIGSALTSALLKYQPVSLVLVEHSENNLFLLLRELDRLPHAVQIISLLCDINDEAAIEEAFQSNRPDFLFHAAAYKHLPLLEEQAAPALRNNAMGTFKLAKLAVQYGCRRFVLLSTDKAVNPTSIMGVSKRICELVASVFSNSDTVMVSVRLGNVVGTRGSVFTIFEDKIRQRQALTVTHPDATRYLLSMEEAVELLLQASWLGSAGEILVPELTAPVTIREIAERCIRGAGLIPQKDIPIEITGLRNGEKMHEELISQSEQASESEIPGIYRVAPPEISRNKLEHWFEELGRVLAKSDRTELLLLIKQIVPEYQPASFLPPRQFSNTL